MKNYELDTNMLPEVWLTWENKSGRVYMDGKTGKRQDHKAPWMGHTHWNRNQDGVDMGVCWSTQNEPRIWVRSGSNLVYAYAKYHADIERLEIAAVKYDTTRGEYAHEWKYAGRRYFIGKDKSCMLEDGTLWNGDGSWSYRTQVFPDHYVCSVKHAINMIANHLNYNDNFVNEFKKFIGENCFLIGNGSTVDIERPWHMSKWYTSVQKARGKGKQQQLTDQLTSMPLSDLSWIGEKYPVKQPMVSQCYALKDVVWCEKVDADWCVLRSFKRLEDNIMKEEWRMYIGANGTTRIVSPGVDGWIPSRQNNKCWGRQYAYLANKDDAMIICPRIKYILSAPHKQLQDHREMDFLISALRFPEIEQMCKLGCSSSAVNIAKSQTPKADLKELFGGYYNDKEKNFLRKIGMTKPQLDAYMEINGELESRDYVYGEWKIALLDMREMFGNDLSFMDIASFNKYLRACKEWRRFKGYRGNLLTDRVCPGIDNARFFKNLVRLMNKRSDIFTLVCDAMEAYGSLRNDRRFNVDWYFDDVSDAVRIHDALVELYNAQREEDRARWNMEAAERQKKEEAKRKKLDETRKIYEYEDDNFIIRLPKTANEIVYEGTAQHICIGSYVSRHSMGDTNLFFLRRKAAPDAPFYAIEMNNSNSIVQIHGFGNRWLGNDPDAIPTVIRWLRKHGIKCDDSILTCKATGYGMVGDFVPMPVID